MIEGLGRRYRQASGHDSRTRNRQYLVRRILWLLQAAAQGTRARGRGPNADETRDERRPRARCQHLLDNRIP